MSLIITLRLRPDEHANLRRMALEGNTGTESVSEFIRLLIHREHNRRAGLPKPKPIDYQGVYRVAGKRKPVTPRPKQFRFKL